MRAAPLLALAAALAAGSAAAQVPAGTADRYGYAPPEAQVPMRLAAPGVSATSPRPALRGPVAAAAPFSPVATPRLRRTLDWPGKAGGPSAGPPPALRVPAALRAPAPDAARAAPRRAAWTPRARFAAPAPVAYAPVAYAATAYAPGPGPSAAPASPAPAPVAYAPPSPAPVTPVQARPAAGDAASALGPPQHPWTERYGDGAAADAGRGVGASLQPAPPAARPATSQVGPAAYAAPQPPPPPVRTAQAPGGTARYYSLHKPYGHGPDPAPIPPQFFGPTADLSTPETPEPARASLTADAKATRAAVNTARLAQGATE